MNSKFTDFHNISGLIIEEKHIFVINLRIPLNTEKKYYINIWF
jgi:hypothetical protein